MEDKNISLVVLGIIGVIAVLGLVLMFSGGKQSTGAVMTSAECPPKTTPIFGGSDWENWNDALQNYENRGFTILRDTIGVDSFGNRIACAVQPEETGAYTNKEAGQNIGYRPVGTPIPAEKA